MPKDLKKRGRRAEKKRKLEEDETALETSTKRQRHERNSEPGLEFQPLENGEQDEAASGERIHLGETPFYGMLDEEEQEYFKQASDMLEADQFSDAEERNLFLENVYREANGKELKLASSQSCSRLLERLIQLSTPTQLRNLFVKFNGEFLHLVQHRFASHCCEALFVQAAPVVSAELLAPPEAVTPADPNEIQETMENLFLHTVNELEDHLGFLMTNVFASHTLRVLLLVLAGLPIEQFKNSHLVQSRKKEHVTHGVAADKQDEEKKLEKRVVPDSFTEALEKVMYKSVAGLDTSYLRALATHQTGNPTLQLLLQLELGHFGKSRAKDTTSIYHTLLPDDPPSADTESAAFINSLLYSTIGSRLLETIIDHSPGKTFKVLHREFFSSRLASLARNDVASYIVIRVLTRLGKDDLAAASELLCPVIPTLVERNRTSVIKALIERAAIRGVDTAPIAAALKTAYSGANGFDITHILKLNHAASRPADDTAPEAQPSNAGSNPEKLHGSLLTQAMLAVPGPLSELVLDAFSRLGTPLSLTIARDASASWALQAALTSPHASVIHRRKIIAQLYGHYGELALDPSGSRVVDAVWKGTQGLAFIRERVAEELCENEAALRESMVGRKVWRNWRMEAFRRKRGEWVQASRAAGADGFVGFPGEGEGEGGEGRKKSAIEMARLRHAKERERREREARDKGKGKEKITEPAAAPEATGSNAVEVVKEKKEKEEKSKSKDEDRHKPKEGKEKKEKKERKEKKEKKKKEKRAHVEETPTQAVAT
ncbi:ARM repeat-containing protein [Trichodelitschia bisporula]|uniref:Nucleolar protein 9 n=1 Tax=Trichodelitschia bisporula TaxID=703511 RepID=A0A6G1HVM8_9PEZI|nr:ARM repeat-containing protein [Trichodelitschia bisporula]